MNTVQTENPKQFLNRLINKKIRIFLKWGQYYEGVLIEFDKYFNFVLSECKEYDNEFINEMGSIFIRCNNVKTVQEILDL
ncbi:hypothetical protein NCER_101246 [Vairimorpha ceranae BRL01]|uniref:Sm protein F n=2 Tax=Vairimorpha ceranae TaxID=40302 RepID=C4V9J8_VAIC1|nr:small nuclear ribonucleoprotein f [Vairimorpha ceranae]EEQ82101.1 hypothetical protein NCER_101246 [Vairimorpha ceranae BRL01]KAF5141100.1 hypothetical protein G9O61_00g007910 [Vairimorpha ceranae]KKO75105.1 small nuclear ribonucleoprotein f [Vairimorpha ceranae]